jgi:RNA polymerase sigma-70 factor (ECF subfamily)
MRETNRAALRNALIEGYDDLKRRLARRLGSLDLAGEALQDTFLRLEYGNEIDAVESPRAYLFRTALNLAANRRVAESRHPTNFEIEALLGIPDDAPDPARIIEARSEVAAMERALRDLPQRRRDILHATFLEEASAPDIAKRHDVSVRTVQIELREALVHCATMLDRPLARRAPPRSRAPARPPSPAWSMYPTAKDTG